MTASSKGTVAESDQESIGEPAIRIRNLSKMFQRAGGSEVHAVDDICLDVARGEFLVLLGPSGCGKSTLLRCAAGLEEPTRGEITLFGRSVYSSANRTNVTTDDRKLSMVFQSYALWPHMTAFENIAYPLRSRHIARKSIGTRVREVLDLLRIPELYGQYPDQMSGGQQQRVALARALVAGDGLVLFDEPLSNVDVRVREELRAELLDMHQRLRFTALYVTHDQLEAMELANSVAVMRNGTIVQQGLPREMYDTPDSHYIAWFLGSVNSIAGTLAESAGPMSASIESPVLGRIAAGSTAAGLSPSDPAVAVIRPQLCNLHLNEVSGQNIWRGRVRKTLYLGSQTEYVVDISGVSVKCALADPDFIASGSEVWFEAPAEHIRLVDPT